MRNHSKGVEFYRELVTEHPDIRLPYLYLLDNLIADHRADEAEEYLARLSRLDDADPVICEVYRAHIALSRFNESEADSIIEKLLEDDPDNHVCLFEAAQYYAEKSDYESAFMNAHSRRSPAGRDLRTNLWRSETSMRSWETTGKQLKLLKGSLIVWRTNGSFLKEAT